MNSTDNENKEEMRAEETTSVEMKKRKPVFLWIGIISVLVIAIILITVFVSTRSSNEEKYKEKMDLGRKYLLEMNYEPAILCFEEAIKIDPKKKDAYLELAEAYVLNGESEKAIKTLETALDEIENESERKKVEEKKKEIEEKELVTTPTPEVTDTPTATLTSTPEPTTTDTLTSTPEPTSDTTPTPESTDTPIPTDTPEPSSMPIGSTNTGDIITFGSYEQDNDLSNGKEPIEWIVLSNDGEKVLLLSKYALDYKQYNTNYADVTWENCTLRAWLNGDFYDDAFSGAEKAVIINSYIENDDNPEYGNDGGNDTYDNLFLLSIDDIINTRYGFSSDYNDYDVERRCAVTEYAVAQGAWTTDKYANEGEDYWKQYATADGKPTCYWWLRSHGGFIGSACYVDYYGDVDPYGDYVGNFDDYAFRCGVRPALYIKLNSSDEESKTTPTQEPIQTSYKDADTGDIITFGSYEQDNNSSNGKEPIEWIVLSNDGDKLLLLSKYALDQQRYNNKYVDITWENCTLRSWLNDDFYNTAFSDNEKATIIKSYIQNNDNSVYGTEGGNDTYDHIFLLSLNDIINTNYGFSSDYDDYDEARCCYSTMSLRQQTCWWWLRSPGDRAGFAAFVNDDGIVCDYGDYVPDYFLVRPALYIDINS